MYIAITATCLQPLSGVEIDEKMLEQSEQTWAAPPEVWGTIATELDITLAPDYWLGWVHILHFLFSTNFMLIIILL